MRLGLIAWHNAFNMYAWIIILVVRHVQGLKFREVVTMQRKLSLFHLV